MMRLFYLFIGVLIGLVILTGLAVASSDNFSLDSVLNRTTSNGEADRLARKGCALFRIGKYGEASWSFVQSSKIDDGYTEYAEKARFLSPDSFLSPWTETEELYASEISVMCARLN